MAELVWDQIVDRQYEVGVDKAVLYPAGGDGVAWSGLVSVSEDSSTEMKPYYYEGLRVLVRGVPGAFSGKIEAITYPDALDDLIGAVAHSPGVRVHDHRPTPFHLCYRTKIGNADGPDFAYKIHLLYNLLATSDGISAKTIGASIEPQVMTWTVQGMQKVIESHQPLDHISLDSREIDPGALATIEAQLYGTAGSDPAMPAPGDLVP